MKSKLFNCKIVLFRKSKIYIREKEFGSWHHEQINLFYLWYYLIFKGTKRGINSCNQEYYYDSLGVKFINWIINRFNNLIDNCLQVIGAGYIGYLILKYFGIS